MLLERKILGRLEGTQVQQFASYLGYNELKDTIRHIGPEHSFTALIPDLSGGIDPDDAFSRVPYEKGSYFLYHLQVQSLYHLPCSPLWSIHVPVNAAADICMLTLLFMSVLAHLLDALHTQQSCKIVCGRCQPDLLLRFVLSE